MLQIYVVTLKWYAGMCAAIRATPPNPPPPPPPSPLISENVLHKCKSDKMIGC